MKKILVFILVIFSSATLTSCFSQQIVVPDDVDIIQVEGELTRLYQEVSSASVGVRTSNQTHAIGTGSGVIYRFLNGYYYVVTNQHVVDDGSKFQVFLGDGKYVTAELIGEDSNVDLAVLRFQMNLHGVELKVMDIFSEIDVILPGQECFAIGSPLGFHHFNYLTAGNVALEASNGDVLHTAAINPGNSGGGLFNYSGRLIGINVSKYLDIIDEDGNVVTVEGMGTAIGMNRVRSTIEKIENNANALTKPVLGSMMNVVNRFLSTEEDTLLLPPSINQALVIKEILFNSPAQRGGLLVNDVIYSMDGEFIDNFTKFENMLNTLSFGQSIEVVIYRYDSTLQDFVELTLSLTLTIIPN